MCCKLNAHCEQHMFHNTNVQHGYLSIEVSMKSSLKATQAATHMLTFSYETDGTLPPISWLMEKSQLKFKKSKLDNQY